MVVLAWCGSNQEQAANEKFAQCLTDKGFMMYWASWCGHCAQQKEMFGIKAFDKVNYVECTKQQTVCELAGVNAYPTWIGDGYKQSGVRTFEELAQASGCEYQKDIVDQESSQSWSVDTTMETNTQNTEE